MIRFFFVALLFISMTGVAPVAADGEYKVETIGALTEAAVSEAVRGVLDARGLRVVDGQGKAVCEVWFRKEMPTVKESPSGALFPQLGEGNFIGVIHFPSNTSDFRGQGIKAGFYTLRYALILQDGNHLGVSPARDFLLLCPIDMDKDPQARIKFDELMKMSRLAAGTGHPSGWSMVFPESEEGLPKVVKNEEEHVILETRIATADGPLAIGLIVIGKTEG